jgi:hypothetical protein
MGFLHVLSGIVWSVSFFTFLDGGVIAAKETDQPYHFSDSLTLVLCFIGLVLMLFVDARALMSGQGDDGDYMGFGGMADADPRAPLKARAWFCLSALFHLGAMVAAVWQMAGPRSGSWPSWAMLVQVFGCMLSASLLCAAEYQAKKPQGDGLMM